MESEGAEWRGGEMLEEIADWQSEIIVVGVVRNAGWVRMRRDACSSALCSAWKAESPLVMCTDIRRGWSWRCAGNKT